MTVNDILQMEITNDRTKIIIRDEDMNLVACGNWYEDCILDQIQEKAADFTWQDDNKIYIGIY